MKKLIALLLLLAMVTLVFASCGKDKESVATTATEPAATTADATTAAAGTTAEETTAVATTVEETTVDPYLEVQEISAANRTFRIQLSAWGDAEKVSKNDKYVAGPDTITEGMTPMIECMVYERNHEANDRLGTSVSYVYWNDLQWGSQRGRIDTLVQGNDPDAPDLFVDMIYDLGNAALNSDFKDIWSIPGSFFDFEADGWMNEWMSSLSLTHDRAYVLAGDYFLDVLRAMGVLPFNVTMMDANANTLAPALLGEPLSQGEDLSARFFDFVELGNWTWDALGKLSEAIWLDVDNDGQDSIADRLGFLGSGRTNMSSSLYLYSNSEDLFVEDKCKEAGVNYGKDWIYYPESSGVLGGIFNAIEALFSGKGTMAPDFPNDGATPENPGLAYHWIKFGQGETLFAGCCVLGALEDDAFQQMSDLYSVVPIPKVNVSGSYNTVIHNVGDAGAINVNTTPDKARALSAFLQYCTENSGEIRQEFLEIVTKYKTTTYNQGTDRMLDIVYNSVVNGRDKSIEDVMGTDGTCKPLRWHVLLKDGNQYTHDASYLTTKYESAISAKQSYLNNRLALWYTLPKVEPEAPAAD